MKLQAALLICLLTCGYTDICPQSEQAHDYFETARTYKKNGDNDQALKFYQKTIALNPRHFDAHFHLACEYYYRGLSHDAITHYLKAIRINPESSAALFNLGMVYVQQNKHQEAYESFTKALTINPSYTQAYFQRGKLLESFGNFDAATEHYIKTIELQSDHIDALAAFAKILRDQEKCEQALQLLHKAAQLQPYNINVWFDLAYTANMIGKTDEALHAYQTILEFIPNHTQTYYNMGYTLKLEGNPAQAITMYKRALELDPNYKQARFALGLAYLNNGEFEQGWAWHEHYLKELGVNGERLRTWLKNNTVAGKRIFLQQQGGFGDSMQFVRYVQVLKNMGAYIIVTTRTALKPLLSLCPYIDEILTVGQPFPLCDDVTTLMALPALFRSTEDTIPQSFPYLFAQEDLVQIWKDRLKSSNTQQKPLLHVGLCWISDRNNDKSRPPVAHRSVPIEALAPFANIQNVQFYSLQKITDQQELANCPEGLIIKTFGPDFDESSGPFMDTAALIKNLDLVISVDTSIAHLAGGLGIPVWLLLPFSVDWRWIAHRTDSPWYPTMRIFKQEKPMNWTPVIQEVAKALHTFIS